MGEIYAHLTIYVYLRPRIIEEMVFDSLWSCVWLSVLFGKQELRQIWVFSEGTVIFQRRTVQILDSLVKKPHLRFNLSFSIRKTVEKISETWNKQLLAV